MATSRLKKKSQFTYQVMTDTKEELDIDFSGKMDVDAFSSEYAKLESIFSQNNAEKVRINLAKVIYFDDFGALLLSKLDHLITSKKHHFTLENASDEITQIFTITKFEHADDPLPILKTKPKPLPLRTGEAVFHQIDVLKNLVTFFGNLLISFYGLLKNPRSFRWNDTLIFMESVGVNALPVVGMIGFLIGLVIAFVAITQLGGYGIDFLIPPMISLAMVSELGPILTGILVAGRSGSAFAAEIGTMKISEEISALTVMGFNPTQFLAIPRMVACALMLPILTIFADFFAIFGGLLVGVVKIGFSPGTYIDQSMNILSVFEICWGLGKSMLFALIIAWVGSLRGFQVRGGADAVGRAATSAVVTSIFLIILSDAILAVLRSVW